MMVAALRTFSFAENHQAADSPIAPKSVKASEVCMVNNSFMGRAQIPVQVDGKTYYGCCEGCVEKLKNNLSLRYANDPVTGNEVDKAKAFITVDPEGTALYFESRETAEAYSAGKD